MNQERTENGIVRFESNFAIEDSGVVSFDSMKVRSFLKSNPDKISTLALSFIIECCGKLGDNDEERSQYLSTALSILEEHMRFLSKANSAINANP